MNRQKQNTSHKRIGQYVLSEKLGQGQFGSVYLAISNENQKKYAIKCQDKKFISENDMYKKLLNTEIGIMNKIKHPNIIHLYELLESINNYYMIIDYCNNGDFKQYMQKRKLKYLEENEAIFFLKQIMNGFKELRKHKVIHRDFKMTNIMVHDDTLKIGDFGLAKKGYEIAMTIVGSYLTMAPELLSSDGKNTYSAKCDLWSIGFVFYEMLFGDSPFFGLTPNEIFQDIIERGNKLKFPKSVSPETKDLIYSLLQRNPEKRIDWHDFFQHPVFELKFPRSVREFGTFNRDDADETETCSEDDVNNEFIKNKYDVKTNKSYLNIKSQINNIPEQKVSTKKVKDDESDSNQAELQQYQLQMKEVAKRYYHEKNKILFIVYTVRNIRELMKNLSIKQLNSYFYCISIYLLKKAIILSDLNLMSLTNGNNIFEQSGFKDFLESSYLNTIADCFKNDKPNFEKYLEYLIDNVIKENLEAETKNILEDFSSDAFILNEIDERVYNLYNKLNDLMYESKIDQTFARSFLLNLVSIFYCINSEKFFPYRIGDEKFEWTSFYEIHEKMTYNELLKVIK